MRDGNRFVFDLDEELSEDNLVAFIVTAPSGKKVQIWTEIELDGKTAILRQFAIYGLNIASLALGPMVLRKMARAAMEEYDVDYIRIEEARRTTGAGPGRTVKPILFKRQAG